MRERLLWPFLGTVAFSISPLGCGPAADEAGSDAPEAVAVTEEDITRVLPVVIGAPDARGTVRTMSTAGPIDIQSPFFRSLGTNGRSCATCHVPTTGWTIAPSDLKARFDATNGLDPIFRTNDGSVSPNADVSTVQARRKAYALLLQQGVIRIGLAVPANAEFTLVNVDDPYGFASAAELSLFRRPLPSTNLRFLSGVMWDARETFPNQSITFDLGDQANGATLGHAQAAAALTQQQKDQIVAFEASLFTAQAVDKDAGDLTSAGAEGGQLAVSQEDFHLGINDVAGGDPTGAPFSPNVFTIFSAWSGVTGNGKQAKARAAIARGEAIFNTKTFSITGVGGLNDVFGVASIPGTCSSCHDAPNAGGHSVNRLLDIGLTAIQEPGLPFYTLRNKTTGALRSTSDPGQALITGKWADIDKVKVTNLRGLAARPPYFHNGTAATLDRVIDFYEQRFQIGLTAQEKSDLVAFLGAL